MGCVLRIPNLKLRILDNEATRREDSIYMRSCERTSENGVACGNLRAIRISCKHRRILLRNKKCNILRSAALLLRHQIQFTEREGARPNL